MLKETMLKGGVFTVGFFGGSVFSVNEFVFVTAS